MRRLSLVWMLTLLGAVGASISRADDKPAAPLTQEQAVKAWDDATAQLQAIRTRLGELQQAFQTATPADQAKFRDEAMQISEKLRSQLVTIGRVAPQVYALKAVKEKPEESEPYQLTASAMWGAFRENRYNEAKQIADTLLSVHPNDPVALNIGGAAAFATNDFDKAVALLGEAEKAMMLIPALGNEPIAGNDPEIARKYVEYWKQEQAIRAKEAAATGDAALPHVLFTTTKGDIELELFENEAPNTVANFVSLVEKGFYDGSPYHRVIPNFMAQGGTPGKKFGGSDGPGYNIECECYRPDARRHFAGTLSMAHAGRNTGGSQFFITHLPTPHLDREMRPDGAHTVFGRVVRGQEVVNSLDVGDQIVAAKVTRKRNHPYQPKTQPGR